MVLLDIVKWQKGDTFVNDQLAPQRIVILFLLQVIFELIQQVKIGIHHRKRFQLMVLSESKS